MLPKWVQKQSSPTESWTDLSQNVIGMSVVQGDYDKLKRFNLAEIYDPSPKAEPADTATESKA
jgi:tRNA acetyltransferase TAN1